MATVEKYHLKLSGRAPDATWTRSRDGSTYERIINDSIELRLADDATDLEVTLHNDCNEPITVHFRAVGHDKHGADLQIEPGVAQPDQWNIRDMPNPGSLEWRIDGEYPTLVIPAGTASAFAAPAWRQHPQIHDPTFKITKGGGG